jgi:hypothetical protein
MREPVHAKPRRAHIPPRGTFPTRAGERRAQRGEATRPVADDVSRSCQRRLSGSCSLWELCERTESLACDTA